MSRKYTTVLHINLTWLLYVYLYRTIITASENRGHSHHDYLR